MHRNLGAVPFDMATEAQRVKVVYTYLNGKIYVGLERRYRASHGWPASRSRLGRPLRRPTGQDRTRAGCGDTASSVGGEPPLRDRDVRAVRRQPAPVRSRREEYRPAARAQRLDHARPVPGPRLRGPRTRVSRGQDAERAGGDDRSRAGMRTFMTATSSAMAGATYRHSTGLRCDIRTPQGTTTTRVAYSAWTP